MHKKSYFCLYYPCEWMYEQMNICTYVRMVCVHACACVHAHRKVYMRSSVVYMKYHCDGEKKNDLEISIGLNILNPN
jgi:hypothetical protein